MKFDPHQLRYLIEEELNKILRSRPNLLTSENLDDVRQDVLLGVFERLRGNEYHHETGQFVFVSDGTPPEYSAEWKEMVERSIAETSHMLLYIHKEPRNFQEPPARANYLLFLAPRKYREHLIGDLEEEYRTVVLPRFGIKKARFWYWWQVIQSLLPILWSSAKRIAAATFLWKHIP